VWIILVKSVCALPSPKVFRNTHIYSAFNGEDCKCYVGKQMLTVREWVRVACIGCIIAGNVGNKNVLGNVPRDLLETTIQQNPPVSLLGGEDNAGACLRDLIARRTNCNHLENNDKR
jgi:hypothetical protein